MANNTIALYTIAPGDGPLPSWAHKCPRCGTVFLGARNARFCSSACRVAFGRMKKAAGE